MHSRRPIVDQSRARGSLGDGRRPVRVDGVLAAHLGAACGGPSGRRRAALRRGRVDHDTCGCPSPRTRCDATAAARAHELYANRAAVLISWGDLARALLPAVAGRRGPRDGLRRKDFQTNKIDRRFRGQTAPRLDRPPRAAQKAAPRRERPPQPLHSKHQVSLKRAHAEAAAQPHP